jgi:Translation initiation factor IF-3, N-terminal domain
VLQCAQSLAAAHMLQPCSCGLTRPTSTILPLRFMAGKRAKKQAIPDISPPKIKRRVDQAITASEVRLVANSGHEVMPTSEALQRAHAQRLQLVEVGNEDGIAVCRIMDYGAHVRKQREQHQERVEARAQAAKAVSKVKGLRVGCAATTTHVHDSD